jgi:hypothetical protein
MMNALPGNGGEIDVLDRSSYGMTENPKDLAVALKLALLLDDVPFKRLVTAVRPII